MSYKNAFIRVSPDCPVDRAVVPEAGKKGKPIHMIQYELLSQAPYRYNHEELIFEVHIRHKGISEEELRERRQEIWDELFSKPHACMRASALPKKYGWGVHYDEHGKIALYGVDSREYREFCAAQDGRVKLLDGMRSSRK
ncbi:DUF6157 family protein [Paenibacillus sp. FSL R5-0527]|uniref:DUF6157 family protein n=1 Tax=Paenibacillus sp. FSL R5-0527 TaxID=2975321 RepID=UPI0026CE73F9